MKNSFTSELREKLKKKLGYCPTCGQPTNITARKAGKLMGTGATTIWRFLQGETVSSGTIDKVVTFLGDEA